MIINKVDPNRESFSDYAMDGAVLTIAGVPVDLVEEQGDQEKIITFASCGGQVHRGMMPCCNYVAEIIIPPRKYDLVEVAAEPAAGGDDGETQEGPGTRTESVPVPLDLDSVVLNLWPVETQVAPGGTMSEGEM